MRFTSRSTKSVERSKYAATVATKSLIETEGEEERERECDEKNNGNYRLTIRFDADGRENDQVNCKLPSFDRGVLEYAEKRHRVDNARVSDICR